MSGYHAREATRLLNAPYADTETVASATAHALLAIEARLSELNAHQQLANLALACSSGALTAAECRRVQEHIATWCLEQLATDNARRAHNPQEPETA